LEPREDTVHYNGYKIKVFGRMLLLESLHVNCDFNLNSSNASGCRSHSCNSFKPQAVTRERESLEQNCDGRRVRIVIRFTGPMIENKVEEANSIMDNVEHNVHFGERTWTLVCENRQNGENFVDILCPTGVHPQSLVYGLMNDLLVIDAP